MRHDAHDTAAGAPLPILMFDERRLSPSFGYVFNPKWVDPHESIVSILWKFARMNALPGHVLAGQLAKKNVDSYEGVEATRDAVDVRRLREALGLPRKLLRSALVPDSLRSAASRYFRYCPSYLAHHDAIAIGPPLAVTDYPKIAAVSASAYSASLQK
ncbi:MAG: hypothetical protein IPI02_18870 [Sterolibacteriaceae bacterium]|nr:hypothetical protein [Sterolibacteriaceae bacterium]